MTYSAPVTPTRRTPGLLVASLLVVTAAVLGVVGCERLSPSSSTPTSPLVLRSDHGGALGEADGVVPDGVTVFDNEYDGLCQMYSNEPWHYELRAGAIDHGCPAMYADVSRDPRMRQ